MMTPGDRNAGLTVTSLSRQRVIVVLLNMARPTDDGQLETVVGIIEIKIFSILFIRFQKLALNRKIHAKGVESKDEENELADKLFRFKKIHFWQRN